MSRRRSRLWWYRRMRAAYKKHGVKIKTRRQTYADATYARSAMSVRRSAQARPDHMTAHAVPPSVPTSLIVNSCYKVCSWLKLRERGWVRRKRAESP